MTHTRYALHACAHYNKSKQWLARTTRRWLVARSLRKQQQMLCATPLGPELVGSYPRGVTEGCLEGCLPSCRRREGKPHKIESPGVDCSINSGASAYVDRRVSETLQTQPDHAGTARPFRPCYDPVRSFSPSYDPVRPSRHSYIPVKPFRPSDDPFRPYRHSQTIQTQL